MNSLSTYKDGQLSAEWLHLSNEAYAAEKFGVRALALILRRGGFSREFSATIERQLSDEIEHTRGYADFVRKGCFSTGGFVESVEELVKSLPNVTLQLFVLQGVVEGLNVGLLSHRLDTWIEYPSRELEVGALEDEQRHSSNSYDFVGELKCLDGVVDRKAFNQITKKVLLYFAGKTICHKPEDFLASATDWPDAIKPARNLQKNSHSSVAWRAIGAMRKSRSEFLSAYFCSP